MQPDAMLPENASGAPLQGHLVRGRRDGEAGTTDVLTVFLAGISLAVYSIVAADGVFGLPFYLWLVSQLAVMFIAAYALRRQAIRSGRELIVSPLLVSAALAALVWEWATRTFLGSGQPFEVVTMSAVRNLVFGLAIVSVWPAQQKLAVVLSLFLTMFGVTASDDLSTQWLAALFAVGAVCWLIVSHWENVRRRLTGKERSHWPRWVFATPFVLLMLVGVGAASADRNVLTALRGFMPSSGGTGRSDPYSRDGVGDGEMLIAGTERIQSFAPIDDAPFLQDDQPSLYDLFDDTYEEEVRIVKTQRAIGLPPDLANRAREHLHNRTEKAHREFSTLRQPRDPAQQRTAPNIHSDALFYVAGRVPLHLRVQVYDLFDGETWYPAEPPTWQPALEMRTSDGKPWLRLKDRGLAREFLGPAETHAVKIVRMDSNVIPSPLYLHGVHIDLVDRPDMFTLGQNGLVALNRETLPSLVPIHLASRSIDWHALEDNSKLFRRVPTQQAESVIPETIDSAALRRLAEQWSGEAPAGWPQIAAIAEHLRQHYTLDPDWRPASTERTGVEQFLFESQRGPDYQFATAAALLLRSQGYATRVVSGFYADPDRYDVDSRHTPVLSNDVHFWLEVRVSGGDWVTVEATPEYEVLSPPPGLLRRAWNTIVAMVGLVARHWLITLATLSGGLLAWWKRREMAAGFAWIRWRWSIWWTPDNAVCVTLALLRRRARLAKRSPGSSTTHHQWLSQLISRCSDRELSQLLYTFRREIDAAAYARDHQQPGDTSVTLCQSVARNCTLTWFCQQRDTQPASQELDSQSLNAHQTRRPESKDVERVGK